MRDRIERIMDSEGLTPSAFADRLGIGRAVMSHILNGRNNPSLDVVTRILTYFKNINSDWLLSGQGEMYKNREVHNSEDNDHSSASDLFSQVEQIESTTIENSIHQTHVNPINTPNVPRENEYAKDKGVQQAQNSSQTSVYKEVNIPIQPPRKVNKIIVFYDDNTFETFEGGKRP